MRFGSSLRGTRRCEHGPHGVVASGVYGAVTRRAGRSHWSVRGRVVHGADQPLLLRLPDIAMFAGSTWLMYWLTASVYGYRAGLWAALVLNLVPVFTLNTAGAILPDGPLVLFCLL